jgi:predicted TIM-barrel fold metal-dependent hydrolase
VIFDCHFHVADPRFPWAGDGHRPQPFTVDDYLARTAHLGITGGAVVSGAFQGYDQTFLLDALERLGPGFVGITQLPSSVSDEHVLELAAAGVRGIRLNIFRAPVEPIADQLALARRVAALADWHTELHVDARRLPELDLGGIPRLSVDHLGRSQEGQAALLELVARGARVKASGFGRGDVDVPSALRAIHELDPGALMFGSDLPSTRDPRRPFEDGDIELVREAAGERALHANAAAFYFTASRSA